MSTTSPETPHDLTSLGKKEERTVSILPPALRAAKALNKKNSLGNQEVTLPVMNKVIICKAFSNIDDISAKTISGSMSAYNDANMNLLYNNIIFQDGHEMSREEFLIKCTEADFRTALYGVMRASFKQLEESRFQCKNKTCPNPDEDKIWSQAINMVDVHIKFPQAPFVSPNNDHTKDLFIAETDILTINYRFDSLKYKLDLFNSKSNEEIRNNLITTGMMIPKSEFQINYIDSIEVKDPDIEGEVYKITQPEDIKMFMNQLDITSRDEIEKINLKYIEHLDGWVPTFETTVVCPHCKTSQKWEDIDIYVEFFRKFTNIF